MIDTVSLRIQISRKDFEPSLPGLDASDLVSCDEEESMKVVRLVKGNEPLVNKILQRFSEFICFFNSMIPCQNQNLHL